MTKFIIACDSRDAVLGDYFNQCKINLLDFLKEKGTIDILEIPVQSCTQPFIEYKVRDLNENPFCFVAYSHGSNNSIVCSGEAYVKANENTHLFKNAFFYTNSCSSGKELGFDLVKNGCKVFIGNREKVKVLLWSPEVSAKLDNYALLIFIEQDITIYEAFRSVLDYYNYEIDKLNSWKDIEYAAELTYARDALMFEGDRDLKFSDL